MYKLFYTNAILYVLFIASSLVACGQSKVEKTNKTQDTPSFTIFKSPEEWKQILNKDQFGVLRNKETEAPYTGKLLYNKEQGVYKCAGCGNELFTDEMKFDSHCGWPSFDKEIAGGKIKKVEDHTNGMNRTEIVCANCGGHLGHLFDDGPTSTGMRYCVNSLSLNFEKKSNVVAQSNYDTITLGGGCYWCVEAIYEMLDGVKSVESGFSGGKVANPSYREVCMGNTGHAEVVQIIYDNK